MNTPRTCAAALLSLVALTACAGPRSPLEVSVKQVGSDVTLGGPSPTAGSAGRPVAPPRQNPTPLGFPAPIQVPPPAPPVPVTGPLPTPSPLPSLEPCPALNPRLAPREATNNITGPPPTAILDYRNVGVAEVTENGTTQKVPYPEVTQRRINSGRNSDGTFGFSVAEQLFGTTTTSTYLVDPKAGLYLTGIVSELPDGSSDSFIPSDPRALLMLPLPVSANVEFRSVGIDLLTQTTVSFDAKVVGKTRVNACGLPVDTWEVRLVNGRTTAPDKQLDYTASYGIATQYGGLSVQDNVVLGCGQVSVQCDSGRSIQARNLAAVNTVPGLPTPPPATP